MEADDMDYSPHLFVFGVELPASYVIWHTVEVRPKIVMNALSRIQY